MLQRSYDPGAHDAAQATARAVPQGTLDTPRFVVVVKGGPVYTLSDQLEYQAELLGRLAPGLILTHGPHALSADVGRVRIECLPARDPARGVLDKATLALRTTGAAIAAIRRARLPGVVVGYDPFRSGAICRAVKATTGATFICEVNGAFANPDNLADEGPAAERKRRAMLAFGSRVLAGADGIRLLYPGQLEGLHAPAPGVPVRVYFDPVPLERFRDEGEQKYLLFVGHPFRRKGVDLLVRAFARIRERFPEWRLVLIGHALEREVRALDVSLERVELRRPMPNAELAPWIARCGIFVLPSRSEAMGRVLLEAAAAAKPRVGAAVDGIPGVIEDGVDGCLFPKEDIVALADTLARLMASRELRQRLGQAARLRVLSDFSGERYVERFAELVNAASRSGSAPAAGAGPAARPAPAPSARSSR